MLIHEMHNNLWYAYNSGSLKYGELREIEEIMREAFSHDNLIGVHQLSIFDPLPDEPFNNSDKLKQYE